MTQWTVQMMKERAIEAAEVNRSLAGNNRYCSDKPASYWPAIEWEPGDYTGMQWRPTARMISEADEFDTWCNSELKEKERHEVRTWAAIKINPKRTLRGYYEKLGLTRPEYDAAISKIFQKLAGNRNDRPILALKGALEYEPKIGEDRARSERTPQFIMADDARPFHLPESAAHKKLIATLQKRQKQKTGATPRAA